MGHSDRSASRFLNGLSICALIVIFGWALWDRFRLPLVPFADDDVWAYLRPGLNALLGQQFQEWFGQCFLYPWLIYVLLLLAGNFQVIAALQGLLSLGTGALLFASWMQLRRLLPAPRIPPWLFKLVGVELVGVYLFSTCTVEFERSLRPEAIFPFIVSLQIYCNLCFIRSCFRGSLAGRSIVSGTLAFFLAIAAVLLKPGFAAAVPFASLPLIISLFRSGEPVRAKLLLTVVPLATVTLLLIWPEWTLRRRDADGSTFLAQSRFSIHADLINKQLGEDIARGAVTPYSSPFLDSVHTALTKALGESRLQAKYWPALGFDPDYLRYGTEGKSSFIRELTDLLGGQEQSGEFCRYYYRRAMRGQIAGMIRKISRQLAVFYRIGRCPAYNSRLKLDLGAEYLRTARVIGADPNTARCLPFASLLASAEALKSSRLQIGPYPIPRWVDRFLSLTHVFWCLWPAVLVVAASRVQWVHAFTGAAAPVFLWLHTYNFGTVLTLAIGHSLDVGRYSQYQLAYTLLADFASMWVAVEAFLFIRAAKFEK